MRRLAQLGVASYLLIVADFAAATTVTVGKVIDGDTVEIDGGERVRLIGIDTPENKRNRSGKFTPAQPFYLEAKNFLAELLAKQPVTMQLGAESVDFYGRTLAYLYLPDGADVQAEMLRRGYAMVTAYPPNIAHLESYGATESQACRAAIGIWGDAHFALQELGDGAPIRNGRGRVAGVVTRIKHTGKEVRIILAERVALLIHRGVWRKFWSGKNADDFIGTRLIARGKIKTTSAQKTTMRIRHPFMLRREICASGL